MFIPHLFMPIKKGVNWLKEDRRKLRKSMTKAEKILWFHIRSGKLGGLRFRRQHGIGTYIADFYHPPSKSVIELDGNIHDSPRVKDGDEIRQKHLESLGCKVIRFRNNDVIYNLENVLNEIQRFILCI